ncbi:MAG TPA: Xaa-Pro peptidase family protein, partial [Actinomycetota bacterium]|nr:Xaa-Pro peptidase family protein [Actinomycetota bacterium]
LLRAGAAGAGGDIGGNVSYGNRMERLRGELGSLEVDALLVTDLTNVLYLTGFSGTNGQALVWGAGAVFMSDPRYRARAKQIVREAEVVIYPDRLTDALGDRLRSAGVQRLGFEASTVTVAERDKLAERLEGIELIGTAGVVEGLRRAKDDDEIEAVRRAARLADEAFEWVLGRIEPGRAERDVALELEMHLRSEGADDVSFEPIVGSGPLSAHIHHTPGERTIQRGDLVLLDFGARISGYCSDLTRTVAVGEPTPEQRDVYAHVLEAQARGIAAIAAGADCRPVDAAARDHLAARGFGEEFAHGLGHGVGLDVHEAPRLHKSSEDTLVEGDIVTVEPGVYRDGWGGIRIEDCVLVTKEGAEVLGRAPKEELASV